MEYSYSVWHIEEDGGLVLIAASVKANSAYSALVSVYPTHREWMPDGATFAVTKLVTSPTEGTRACNMNGEEGIFRLKQPEPVLPPSEFVPVTL